DRDVDAELTARRTLGNSTYYREEVRAMTPLAWLDRVRQDAGYAWRGLLRTPTFTATVVATLGLGIGVNAAMWSLVDRVLFRPPAAVHDPNELRRLYWKSAAARTLGGPDGFPYLSYPQFAAVRARAGDSLPFAIYSPSFASRITTRTTSDSARVSY